MRLPISRCIPHRRRLTHKGSRVPLPRISERGATSRLAGREQPLGRNATRKSASDQSAQNLQLQYRTTTGRPARSCRRIRTHRPRRNAPPGPTVSLRQFRPSSWPRPGGRLVLQRHLWWDVSVASIVAGACLVLAPSPPGRPPPDVFGAVLNGEHEFSQQAANLGHRVVDQSSCETAVQAPPTGSRPPFSGVLTKLDRVADNQARVSIDRVMCAYQAR